MIKTFYNVYYYRYSNRVYFDYNGSLVNASRRVVQVKICKYIIEILAT